MNSKTPILPMYKTWIVLGFSTYLMHTSIDTGQSRFALRQRRTNRSCPRKNRTITRKPQRESDQKTVRRFQ